MNRLLKLLSTGIFLFAVAGGGYFLLWSGAFSTSARAERSGRIVINRADEIQRVQEFCRTTKQRSKDSIVQSELTMQFVSSCRSQGYI
ncbi:hypothetical protein MRS76_09905 [Rhizobiaceae bacterium n13]|uniref:Uncharacterized protein n=1 Tax=Ferirhizobium litorale TaxID=2927786 RepID=A0AAE3QEC4_9HYPH|nr:hypothetical protein [Fererhizobium litorale]MDI7862271.1 hypothetical protein [Fererhizobium litorale]MDI7922455.1 hypothetical protein [Fererhizobium litorale]